MDTFTERKIGRRVLTLQYLNNVFSLLFCRLKATLLSDVQFNFNCHITTPPTKTKLSSLYSALHQFAALLTTMPAGPDLDDLIKLLNLVSEH